MTSSEAAMMKSFTSLRRRHLMAAAALMIAGLKADYQRVGAMLQSIGFKPE